MFRAAHRSSSGALNCICSLWFICCSKVKDFIYIIYILYYVYISFTLLQHENQRLQIQFIAHDDERCVARNVLSLQ